MTNLELNKEYTLKTGEVITYGGVFIESPLSSLCLHTFNRKVGAPYTITIGKLKSWI